MRAPTQPFLSRARCHKGNYHSKTGTTRRLCGCAATARFYSPGHREKPEQSKFRSIYFREHIRASSVGPVSLLCSQTLTASSIGSSVDHCLIQYQFSNLPCFHLSRKFYKQTSIVRICLVFDTGTQPKRCRIYTLCLPDPCANAYTTQRRSR